MSYKNLKLRLSDCEELLQSIVGEMGGKVSTMKKGNDITQVVIEIPEQRRINGTVLFIFDCINLWGQPSKLTLRNVLLLRQTAERRIERIIAKVFDRKDKFRYNHERRYYDQN